MWQFLVGCLWEMVYANREATISSSTRAAASIAKGWLPKTDYLFSNTSKIVQTARILLSKNTHQKILQIFYLEFFVAVWNTIFCSSSSCRAHKRLSEAFSSFFWCEVKLTVTSVPVILNSSFWKQRNS